MEWNKGEEQEKWGTREESNSIRGPIKEEETDERIRNDGWWSERLYCANSTQQQLQRVNKLPILSLTQFISPFFTQFMTNRHIGPIHAFFSKKTTKQQKLIAE